MGKNLFIAEKPSVGRDFAKVFNDDLKSYDGYQEGNSTIVTWCFGHLVRMSYPEVYDEKFKKWRMETIPFIPEKYLYEVDPSAKKQFDIVKGLLNRPDVSCIYVCTDSGREGEYIYRLVAQMAGVKDKEQRRVWIDSQTEDEIKRGIREAKALSEYDNLSDAAYLRAKVDYLMGINFSRVLSIKYGRQLASELDKQYCSIAVGRVMTCVQGMVVKREREIRCFEKTPFYRVLAQAVLGEGTLGLEWKDTEGSAYHGSALLYSQNGFKEEKDAKALIATLPMEGVIDSVDKKKEKKNPPLLYNLAEAQNDCSKFFKISPKETLDIIQNLYEKKLVTYPRTDARVLSSAIAKEIDKNIRGLYNLSWASGFAKDIIENGRYKGIEKTRYTNDKQITDHYAIIPTGQGLNALSGLDGRSAKVYELIVRRFLAIFYPAAIYEKVQLSVAVGSEHFFASDKYLKEDGYKAVMEYSFKTVKTPENKKDAGNPASDTEGQEAENENESEETNEALRENIDKLTKGSTLSFKEYTIKEGVTSPPKRYNSGSLLLAMENAGQLIEDEELRSQIKTTGIGTAATRADIIEKLVHDGYLNLNKKTQIITPTLLGEMIVDVVTASISQLLSPELTASWEKGLEGVAAGNVTSDEYMTKLDAFIRKYVNDVKLKHNAESLHKYFAYDATFYKNAGKGSAKSKKTAKAGSKASGKTETKKQ